MFNANNYGYNPQGRYVPQYMEQMQPTYVPQQPIQRPTLYGKQVDSLEVVKATDIGLSGDTYFFPLTDGSQIITKQLNLDGTSKITIYKPILDTKEEVKYMTMEDVEKAINNIDLSKIDDIEDELSDLRKEIKEMKKRKKDD